MNEVTAAVAKIRRWREDPVSFVREVFGVEPDAWQVDVLRAFPTHQRIAMKACKGPGKSAVDAWLAWNFLATRLHPKIAATSVTGTGRSSGLTILPPRARAAPARATPRVRASARAALP